MKKTKYLLLGIIITSSLLSSCNEGSIGGNQTSPADSLKTKVAPDSLAIVGKDATDEFILDSINQSNYFSSIEGTYQSNETKTVEYAGGPQPSEYPYLVLTIKSENDKFIIEEIYDGDVPYGCGGPYTEANAEIIRIEKIDDVSFKLIAKKLKCQFSDMGACEDILIKEANPKKNTDFTLTIKKSENNQIKITSTAIKSKCKFAWDFKGLTFRKIK